MAPWLHLLFSARGEIFPCCMADSSQALGNLQTPVDTTFNGEKLKSIRAQMLKGERPQVCRKCFALEDSGSPSFRQHFNKEYEKYSAELLECTQDDGSVSRIELRYLDFRMSNTCNLRCRSCGPELSTSWHEDFLALNPGSSQPRQLNLTDVAPDYWEKLKPYLSTVEEINFSGGEPLLLREHYEFLEKLIEKGWTHIQLKYNTNLSRLKLGRYDVLKLWPRFKRVIVGASLDGVGARGELLRKGLVWSEFVENALLLRRSLENLDFSISPTLSAMNALHLPEAHRVCVELGLIEPQHWPINKLVSPSLFSAQILPQQLKFYVTQSYEAHLRTFIRDETSAAWNEFSGALNFVLAKDLSAEMPRFLSYTLRLDQLRGENFFAVFPELSDINYSPRGELNGAPPPPL